MEQQKKKQPSGLITPVVNDVSNKSMLKISAEAKDMAARLSLPPHPPNTKLLSPLVTSSRTFTMKRTLTTLNEHIETLTLTTLNEHIETTKHELH